MFHSPAWLAAALLILPGTWGLLRWASARRDRVTDALGRSETLRRVVIPARRSPSVRTAAIAFLLLALAGPRFGVELVETRSDSRQAVIAIDVSRSMLTPDVKPTRLERAKTSLSLLIDQLRGERIGVVAFAGVAEIVCPLTQDADAAKQLLGALEVGAVPTPGSAVGSAIRTAVAMLGRYPGGKALILLTDGEDHKTNPLGAAKEASISGITVYTVGIGTPEGEPIPGADGTYHKDAKGGTVVSRLDEGTLATIARETGGAYYRSSPGSDEIAAIADRVRELAAAKGLSGTANMWRNRYAWPATATFLLLLIELILAADWRPRRRPASPGKPAVLAALALVALAPGSSFAATAESELRAGNRLYKKKNYEDALERYGAATAKRPQDPRSAFNTGDALYRLARPDDSAAAFETVAANKDAPQAMRAGALYNLGNARFKAGDFPAAAAAFRGALALAPDDADARHNLAVTFARIKNPPPPDQQKPKGDTQKPKDDKDKPKGGGDGQGGGEQPKSPPKTRPQDALTKEEAERILRAVSEREKQAQKQAAEGRDRRVPAGKAPSAEDW
jgi:Ca-activated chloride channel family protein